MGPLHKLSSESTPIQHVSDTAIWVAYYRALESERADALFKDRFAKLLVGSRGQQIADSAGASSRYTQWSVVIRTVVIDRLIQEHVGGGVGMVVNLGAGLDTRPYRLQLPGSLRWVEIDFPDVLEHKAKILGAQKPGVLLDRFPLDLSHREKRQELFSTLGSQSKKALILTEGVIPYLTEEQVATLAQDLHAQTSFQSWVAEYYAPELYRYFRSKQRLKQMKNAPFQFFPTEWFAFFKAHGWIPQEVKYLPKEGLKLNRGMPHPWWARIFTLFMSQATLEQKFLRQFGYAVLAKAEAQA